MDFPNPHTLRSQARESLEHAEYPPRRLVLIHSGISLGAVLLVTVLNYLLSRQISTTGGLSGLGLRGILSTLSTLLETIINLLLPIWAMGFTAVCLRLCRNQPATPATFLACFQRLWVIIRLQLVKSVIILLIAMVLFYPSFLIFCMTPLARPLMRILMPVVSNPLFDPASLLLDEATSAAVIEALLPMLGIYLALVSLAVVPILFVLRQADYLILDIPGMGALAAMGASLRMMRGRCKAFLRLDLGFWWYYAASILIAVVSYADVLLSLAGISLPIQGAAAFFAPYLIHIALQLGFDLLVKAKVGVTYALAYHTLLHTPPQG